MLEAAEEEEEEGKRGYVWQQEGLPWRPKPKIRRYVIFQYVCIHIIYVEREILIYIYIYVNIYTHINMYFNIYTYMLIYIYIHINIYINILGRDGWRRVGRR